jgi:hypothetical protein
MRGVFHESAPALRYGKESSAATILIPAPAQTVVRCERIAAGVALCGAMRLSLLAESQFLFLFCHGCLSVSNMGQCRAIWALSLASGESGRENVEIQTEKMVGPCGLEPQTSTVSR